MSSTPLPDALLLFNNQVVILKNVNLKGAKKQFSPNTKIPKKKETQKSLFFSHEPNEGDFLMSDILM